MAWCEANRVDYLFGLARNDRLVATVGQELADAMAESLETGKAARRFKDFRYSTLKSWSRERRVVGKAEVTRGDTNPRFVVTSLSPAEAEARHLYEKIYCAPRARWRTGSKSARRTCLPTAHPQQRCAPTSCVCGFASMAYVLLCAPPPHWGCASHNSPMLPAGPSGCDCSRSVRSSPPVFGGSKWQWRPPIRGATSGSLRVPSSAQPVAANEPDTAQSIIAKTAIRDTRAMALAPLTWKSTKQAS